MAGCLQGKVDHGQLFMSMYVDEKHILVGGFKQFLFSIMLG